MPVVTVVTGTNNTHTAAIYSGILSCSAHSLTQKDPNHTDGRTQAWGVCGGPSSPGYWGPALSTSSLMTFIHMFTVCF